jgi:hypothetical protein
MDPQHSGCGLMVTAGLLGVKHRVDASCSTPHRSAAVLLSKLLQRAFLRRSNKVRIAGHAATAVDSTSRLMFMPSCERLNVHSCGLDSWDMPHELAVEGKFVCCSPALLHPSLVRRRWRPLILPEMRDRLHERRCLCQGNPAWVSLP